MLKTLYHIFAWIFRLSFSWKQAQNVSFQWFVFFMGAWATSGIGLAISHKKIFPRKTEQAENWFIPSEFRLLRGTQKSRNSVLNPFRGREKCSEFRTVELNWSKTLGISFRTIPWKRKHIEILFRGTWIIVNFPEFCRSGPVYFISFFLKNFIMLAKILSSWHIPLTKIEKPFWAGIAITYKF